MSDYNVITMTAKTRIVRIGNSRGIRIPKTLLEEAELPDEVKGRATIWAILAMYGEYARKSLLSGFDAEEVVHAGEQTGSDHAAGGKAD